MTIAQQIGQRNAAIENTARLGDFARLVRCLMLANGKLGNALVEAEQAGLRDDVQKIIRGGNFEKAAQTPLALTSTLADYSILSSAFVGTLTNTVFDQLVGSMIRVPLVSATVGAVSVGATAFSVSEGSAKAITRLSLVNQTITPQKVAAGVAVTKELARSNDTASLNFIIGRLRSAVAQQTDAAFISTITSGVSTIPSAGTTTQAIKNDISNSLQAITTGSDSKLFWITTSLVAKMLTTLLFDQSPTFAAVTPLGGTLAGLPLLVSDGVTIGQLLLVDAGGLAGNAGEVFLRIVEEGLIHMDTAPDSPPVASTLQQSLWQLNQVGVLCERYLVCAKLRSDAVAIIQTTNSYTGGSP